MEDNKRDPPQREGDPIPNKRTHLNEARTTQYIHVNNGSSERMRDEGQNNGQREEEEIHFEIDFIDVKPEDSKAPEREFLLSYKEARNMMGKTQPKIFQKIHQATGINLFFPFKQMHEPQKKFISKIYQALDQKKQLICQSSTGTGKTLSLLVGCFSWIQSRKLMLSYGRGVRGAERVKCIQEVGDIRTIYLSKSHSQLGQIQKQLQKLPYSPKMVLYGSRDKLCNNTFVNWRHGINEDKYDEMRFRCNAAIHYMQEFKRVNRSKQPDQNIQQKKAFQGSRNTVYNLIKPIYAELDRKAKNKDQQMELRYLKQMAELYLIEFSQLNNEQEVQNYQQRIRELGKALDLIEEKRNHQTSNKQSNENSQCDLQARRQVEMENQFKEEMKRLNIKIIEEIKGNRPDIYYTNELIKQCLEKGVLTSEKKRQLETNTRQLWSMESKCSRFIKKKQSHDTDFFNFLNPNKHGTPINIKTIKQKADEFMKQPNCQVCTYFHSKRIDRQGDLYLMPYNYLLDQTLLPIAKRLIKNSILVFDEAHNVDSAAREGYSSTLNKKMREQAEKEIKQPEKKRRLAEKDMEDADDEEKQRFYNEQMDKNINQIEQRIIMELRQEEIEYQRNLYFSQLAQRQKQQRRMGNDQNQNTQNENRNEPTPIFQCKVPDRQLKKRLINSALQISNVIGENMTKYFKGDLVGNQGFKMANNNGVNIQGWRDYTYRHTSVTSEIRELMVKVLFSSTPYIEGATAEEFRNMKVLNRIIKKFDQVIDLKYAQEKFNFKIKALQRFFVKLRNVIFNKQYQGEYYLILNQQLRSTSSQDNEEDKKLKAPQFQGEVSLKCLSSKFAFQALQKLNPRSIIITSGTLSPMNRLKDSLGLIDCLAPVPAGSVIKQQNIHVRKIYWSSWIISKYFFLKDYKNQHHKEFVENAKSIFEFLVELVQRIPNGVLIIISSYSLSTKLQRFFKSQEAASIRKKFLAAKPFVYFQKKKDNPERLISKYSYFARKQPGAALFCVSRAKLTEGIDFKDELCRGVIVVGVPLLNKDLPEVVEMKNYIQNVVKDEKYCEDWMNIEVSKAINQGLGRVVRDERDYGAIFLIDQRYTTYSGTNQNIVRDNISGWIRDSWKDVYSHQRNQEFKELTDFFEGRKAKSQSNKNQQQNSQNQRKTEKIEKKSCTEDLTSSYYRRNIKEPQQKKTAPKYDILSTQKAARLKVLQYKSNYQYNIDDHQDKEFDQALLNSKLDDQQIKERIENLKEQLLLKGLQAQQIKGDGNCLYRCASYLHPLLQDQKYFGIIKQIVLEILDRELEGPPYLVKHILLDQGLKGSNRREKLRKYKEKMSKGGEYGTQAQLWAISYAFGMNFFVHMEKTQPSPFCYPDPKSPVTFDNTFHLGYNYFPNHPDQNHYFTVRPIGMSTSQYNRQCFNRQIEGALKFQRDQAESAIIEDHENDINNANMTNDGQMKDQKQQMLHHNEKQKIVKQINHPQIIKQTEPIINSNPPIINSNPPIINSNEPIIKQQEKSINYKSYERQISQDQRNGYSQKGRIKYSSKGTILKLKNLGKKFNINEFLSNDWENVQILEMVNCHIFNAQWQTFVLYSSLFPNLRYIDMTSNRVNQIKKGDLSGFSKLRYINFNYLMNPASQTEEYLKSLKQKYQKCLNKQDLVYVNFRK